MTSEQRPPIAEPAHGTRKPGGYPPDMSQTAPIPVADRGADMGWPRRRRTSVPNRRLLMTLAGAVVVAMVVAAAIVVVRSAPEATQSAIPTTTAAGVAVVQVLHGDSLDVIGERLAASEVVASAMEFSSAAQAVAGEPITIAPGYYAVAKGQSADSAVQQLLDVSRRVGSIIIDAGNRLDDIVDPVTGSAIPGILTVIARASCVPAGAQAECVSVEELRRSAADADVDVLKVPPWAQEPVDAMTGDLRRLEGLLAVGRWSFDPTATPTEILASIIDASVKRYEHNSVLQIAAQEQGLTPYQVLIAASIVQLEGPPAEFPRIALDISDRLRDSQPLQRTSTMAYFSGQPVSSTSNFDTSQDSPWNTFVRPGLPATPIGAPGDVALAAAQHP